MLLVDVKPATQAPPENSVLGKSTWIRKLLVLAAALCFALLAAFFYWRFTQASAVPQFQTARVERGVIESRVSATGTCNAVVNVQVGSQVSGNIKALYADFNSVVKAGQLVALIDPQLFQAQVDQARAAWRYRPCCSRS